MNNSDHNPGKGITFSETELEELNRAHTAGGAKWIGMFSGISSQVTEVRDGILSFEIVYPEDSDPDDRDPELLIALLFGREECPRPEQLQGMILREYTASGRAGFFYAQDELSESQLKFEQIRTSSFGEDRLPFRSRIYDPEQIRSLQSRYRHSD